MKKQQLFIFLFFLSCTVSYAQHERFVVKNPSANYFMYHFEKGECIINTNYNEIPDSIFNKSFILPFDSSSSLVITDNRDGYKYVIYKNQKYSYYIQYVWKVTAVKSKYSRIYCYARLTFEQSRLDTRQEKLLLKYTQFIEEEDSIRFMFRDILQKEYEKYILQKLNIDLNVYHQLSNAKKVILCEEENSLKDTLTLNTKYNSLKIRNIRVIDTLEKTVCEDLVLLVTNKSNIYSPIYVDCFIPNYKLIFMDEQEHVLAIINLQYPNDECSGYDYKVYVADKFEITGSANIMNGKDFIRHLFSTFNHK